MSDAPLVSIVLPTYNGSRYLEQSIRSCLTQTMADFELIIVDDCSSDLTPEIIAEFVALDPRIRSIRNDPNRRLPASLNRGFEASRGRYLTWTSDDNLYRPEALARMVAVLDREPAVGLVYSAMSLIDEDAKELGPGWGGGAPDMLAYRSSIGACFLYRREVYESIGGYAEDLFLVEDWDYWLRIAEKFPLHVLPDDLYLYRLHGASLTRQKKEKHQQVTRQLLERHLPNMRWASGSARAHGYLLAARMAWKFGDRRAAISHMASAFRQSPTYTLGRFAGEPLDRLLKRRAHRPALEPGS
jgi:glycosyltransferase involved in cell wall biosynthesis